jgi:hypothetical protein
LNQLTLLITSNSNEYYPSNFSSSVADTFSHALHAPPAPIE